jgi:NAD(P)-dependent dehydrogenase (short-subunit alcohol dehydrogenase family)
MKTIIITGAAGNLGRAVVKKFLDSDYQVIAIGDDIRHLNKWDSHANLETHELNAMNEKEAHDFIQSMITKHGKIDAALLLIGGFAMGSIENTGEKELQKMFSLNFNTLYFTARPIFNQMLKQNGGKLIFVGTVPALSDNAGYDMIAYTLSKSLVIKLAKILNSEGHKKNVKCSVIAPTTIDTPENRTSMPDADFSKWTKAEEIADMMEFIISPKGDKMKDVIIKM